MRKYLVRSANPILRALVWMLQVGCRTAKAVRSFHVMKLASALFAQLGSLFLVYVLTPSEYGQFALLATVAQLMFILTCGWSSGAIINLAAQSFSQTGSYKAIVLYRFCIVVASFVLITSVFTFFSPLIEKYMKIDGLYLYVLLLFLGYIFFDYASQLLYPGNRDRIQAGIECIFTFIFLLLAVFFVKDWRTYVIAYVNVSLLFATVITFLFLIYFRHQHFEWRRAEFLTVLNYSAWQMIGILSIYVVNMGMNYVLAISHIPLEKIGLYNLSLRLYLGLTPFFALFAVLMPKWIHSPGFETNLLKRKILKIVLLLTLLYLILGIMLMPLIKIFSMEQYSLSVVYYFWFLPAFIFTAYANLQNAAISNTASFRKAQYGILLQAGVLIVVCFSLVSTFGIGGAITSITLASAAGAIYFHQMSEKIFHSKPT